MGNALKKVALRGEKVFLRSLNEEDLPILWKLIYGDKDPVWKKWDAPYYSLEPHTLESYRSHEHARVERLKRDEPDSRLVIIVQNKIIGTVTYYWEHKPSLWLEIGIGIYNPAFWCNGYGTEALGLWIEHLFNSLPIERVGLTTWSKNERMMHVGKKLGMKLEGRLRKCRFFEGTFYDSIRMGILREEWESRQNILSPP
ncbi:GNAT family protein [Halobacillus rhizosphaerae]|uniref:GNAT family N-acetyltransferase n=1 Tax=Halobacillus rhizosphaerae TaxID=3064889 RepID=UPI00398A57E9